jgi:hypothetical protein
MTSTENRKTIPTVGRLGSIADDDAERVLGALRGLRYGAVTVVVHDGMIVQVERTEKVRVPRRADPD